MGHIMMTWPTPFSEGSHCDLIRTGFTSEVGSHGMICRVAEGRV